MKHANRDANFASDPLVKRFLTSVGRIVDYLGQDRVLDEWNEWHIVDTGEVCNPSCFVLFFLNAFSSPALTCSTFSLTVQATISLINPTHIVSPSHPRRMAKNPFTSVRALVRGLYRLIFRVAHRRPDTEDNPLSQTSKEVGFSLLFYSCSDFYPSILETIRVSSFSGWLKIHKQTNLLFRGGIGAHIHHLRNA
jgi:hypothetical protein